MSSLKELSALFESQFKERQFPEQPQQLYDAAQYLLTLGGKRIRPVLCLMANELFGEINKDTFHVANAIELFHNFTLVHDDIMDKSAIRRGQPTVHTKYNEPTALLAGDVMLVTGYEHLNKIQTKYLPRILSLFNKTAKEVCEGQQLDMEFENRETVSFEEYETMITLKTSVALAASMELGAIMGGAGLHNQHHLYEFGKFLGVSFQVQDDYLDAFGDPQKFGKTPGGDIVANKKTFLLIHALNVADNDTKASLNQLFLSKDEHKVESVLQIYKDCGVDDWARQLKNEYYQKAMIHLEEVAVIEKRKGPLKELAAYLLNRSV
ncbi:MAG: polyprenyl synthetase family protein [Bacteroidetes bacterium]|nr:polyprenyl synthetase family protein [Bacteroidota bacterium]